MKKELNNFLMWLHYNHSRISIDSVSLNVEKKYIKATKGKNKYCNCQNHGKAINEVWSVWHCTYCMKLIKKNK